MSRLPPARMPPIRLLADPPLFPPPPAKKFPPSKKMPFELPRSPISVDSEDQLMERLMAVSHAQRHEAATTIQNAFRRSSPAIKLKARHHEGSA